MLPAWLDSLRIEYVSVGNPVVDVLSLWERHRTTRKSAVLRLGETSGGCILHSGCRLAGHCLSRASDCAPILPDPPVVRIVQ